MWAQSTPRGNHKQPGAPRTRAAPALPPADQSPSVFSGESGCRRAAVGAANHAGQGPGSPDRLPAVGTGLGAQGWLPLRLLSLSLSRLSRCRVDGVVRWAAQAAAAGKQPGT